MIRTLFGFVVFGLAAFFIVPIGVNAQAPSTEWFTGQGTHSEEHVHEGFQTADGGYIAIGHGIERSYADDILIIKVDENGRLEWKQQFGTAGQNGAGYCLVEVDGGYIAGGAIFDPQVSRTQRFLAKINTTGIIEWQSYYRSPGVGGIRSVDVVDDGGIITTGYVNAPNIPEFQGYVFIVDEGNGFIMKVDAAGAIEWEKPINAPQGAKVQVVDDGFALCTTRNQDFCLIKTDNQGNTLWQEHYGGRQSDHLYDFAFTRDGGFILAGHTLSFGVMNWDYLLIKVNADGEEEWHNTYGQPRGYDARYIHDEAYGVKQTADGGFIIAGGSGDEYAYSETGHPSGSSDVWKAYLVKTDSAGTVVWEAVYPDYSGGNNSAEDVGLTKDGGYIVFADTDSQTPPGPNNFGFLKLTPEVKEDRQ